MPNINLAIVPEVQDPHDDEGDIAPEDYDALDMFNKGMSARTIAKIMKMRGAREVHAAMNRAMYEVTKYEQLRREDRQALQGIKIRKQYHDVSTGVLDDKSSNAMVRLLERESKLYGLDEPVKVTGNLDVEHTLSPEIEAMLESVKQRKDNARAQLDNIVDAEIVEDEDE